MGSVSKLKTPERSIRAGNACGGEDSAISLQFHFCILIVI